MSASEPSSAPSPAGLELAAPATWRDVVVVGAGPAGSAAASYLARAGLSVTLVDKATFPRDKCCGDGLTTLALRELERLGFEPPMVADWSAVDAAWLRTPSGREVAVPLPTGAGTYAAVTPRLQLDETLMRIAADSGAELWTGSQVADVALGADRRGELGHGQRGLPGSVRRDGGGRRSASDDAVAAATAPGRGAVITLDDGRRLAAQHVVAADGMWSPVRKALGLTPNGYLGEWHAFRQYVTDVTGPAAERLYVWFDADLLPGYAWSFPLPGGRANIGFGVLRTDGRGGRAMKDLWAGLIDRDHIRGAMGPDAELEGRHLAWPIPARIDRAPLAHGDVLFTGDAAGASDVLTGEGIGQALLTGRLAAESIIAARVAHPGPRATKRSAGERGVGERSAGDRYTTAVRRELVADHKMSALLGRVLAHRRGAEGSLRIVAASGSWGRRNFARWMFEDEPRAGVATPRRWHRRFLSRPGAFAPARKP